MAEQLTNRYELLETLGRGGEGRVVKALDRQHERVVALKIRTVRDDVDRDELLAEARVLLEVPSHPSLPLVREDFFENGEYLIAMDFVDGIDLARLLASRGEPGLAPSSVLTYLADAADALTHLHTQHPPVIHGDVKPGNLILTRGGRVKLVDFGMSSTPVPRRRRVGTPGFRAPELAADFPASRASDIYSLAATAFALLTGSAPDGRLPTWEGFDPQEAAQLEAVLRDGLSNDPERRPQTPGEFVERLRAGWASSLPTGVMTFCLSDIEGSTPMWEERPELMATALVRHDELIADIVEARGGRFLKSMGEGDSTVSVFPAAVSAVEAAIEITRGIAREPWPDGIEMRVRIGLHTGEAERRATDYIGPTLNLAARLRGQADGGQVFCSATTADLVSGHLPDGHDLVDLGPHHLKGIRSAQRVFAIAGPGLDTPFPSTSCPYRGLLAFGSEDRDLFFGREDVVASVLGRLAQGRLLALVGASGSGKSSVLRAGVVAAACAGEVPGCRTALVTTPGSTPTPLAHESDTLLVVDQFEELFTLCTDGTLRTAYIEALVAHPGCVVIGVRADFYGQLSSHAALARAVTENQILLGAMTGDDLCRAITEPARLAGLKLEPGLVDVIVRDIAGEPGALPLLSHALRATWERRDGRTMTLDGYRETGGVESAIARSADTIFDETSEDIRPLLRGLLLRLTEIGDGVEETRRRVDIPNLVPAGASRLEVESVLDRLADARLVTLDEGTAEVAHEALIREWPRLRSWLDEDRDGLQLHRRLGDAARIWDATGREPSDLYRGARLAAVEEWAGTHSDDLNANERAFLDASEHEDQAEAGRQRRANRRLRRLLVGTAIALVVALVAGMIAVSQRNHADAARSASVEERDRGRIARLVAESERELDSHLDLAFLLAAEAWRREDSPATRGALLTALTHNVTSERERLGSSPDHGGTIHRTHSSFAGFLTGPPRAQLAVDVSANGRIVASAGTAKLDGTGGLVLVFDTGTRREIGRFDGAAAFHALAVSADGRTVVAASDRTLVLYEIATRTAERLDVAPPPGERFANVALRPDHTELLVTTTDGGITLWDWAAHAEVDAELPPTPVNQGAFRPDGTLVVDQPGFELMFWDIDRGAALETVALEDPGVAEWTTFSISADGRRLAGAQNLGRVFLWDLATGRLVGDPAGRPGTVGTIAFDPRDRSILATGRIGGAIEFYDVAEERLLGEPRRGHGGALRSLVYSADARYLVSTADDGLIGLWTDNGSPGLMSRTLSRDAVNPVLSADGSTMLLRNGKGKFVVWNDSDPQRPGATLQVPSGGPAPAFGFPAALTADGRRALVTPEIEDPHLQVADTRTGSVLWTDEGRELNTQLGALSPDGQTVAALDPDQTRLILVDVDSGRRRATATVPDGADWFSSPPRFTADGDHVHVALRRGIARYSTDGLHPERVVKAGFDLRTSVAEVPGTDDVIAGGGNGLLGRWNLETGELIETGQSSDPSGMFDLAVSSDGRSVAAYHFFTYELALFDATTLRSVGRPFPVGDLLFSPRFSADGRYVYGNGLLGGVARWDVDPHRWLGSACLAAGRNLTRAEWDEYLGRDEPYRPTCVRWAR